MWQMFQRHKRDRVMILTTHHMDEADLLGDRVAVLSKGKVRVCGTSLFLKRQFGLGYHLNMLVRNQLNTSDRSGREEEKKEDDTNPPRSVCDLKLLEQVVKDHVPGSALESSSIGEVSFVLPQNSASQLILLFEYLGKMMMVVSCLWFVVVVLLSIALFLYRLFICRFFPFPFSTLFLTFNLSCHLSPFLLFLFPPIHSTPRIQRLQDRCCQLRCIFHFIGRSFLEACRPGARGGKWHIRCPSCDR